MRTSVPGDFTESLFIILSFVVFGMVVTSFVERLPLCKSSHCPAVISPPLTVCRLQHSVVNGNLHSKLFKWPVQISEVNNMIKVFPIKLCG